MSFSKILSITLCIAAVHTSSVLHEPSQVLRRQAPEPSAYPLGDACGNEWQYLNFDPTDDTDSAHLRVLHDIICSGEMRAICNSGGGSAASLSAPYRRYFLKSDGEDDFQRHVSDVLGLIAGNDNSEGEIGTVVGTFVVDNNDFAGNDPNEIDCINGATLAYTLTDSSDNREKIHFCDPAWTRGKAADIDCATLDPFPSTKMDSFSRIALHEMARYSSVGPETSLNEIILDVRNQDDELAYNPPRVHGLVDVDQDDNPALTDMNAGSYAWMSMDSWISRRCAEDDDNWESFFTQNPPPYR